MTKSSAAVAVRRQPQLLFAVMYFKLQNVNRNYSMVPPVERGRNGTYRQIPVIHVTGIAIVFPLQLENVWSYIVGSHGVTTKWYAIPKPAQ